MAENLILMQAMNDRICNDIAESVGIIDNCLGLLDAKNKSIVEKAKLLVDEESANLIRRLNFFRDIYGLSEDTEKMSIHSLTKLLSDFFFKYQIKPKLHFTEKLSNINYLLAKASICLTIIANESVSSNGEIDVFFADDKENNPVKITLKDKNLRIKKESFAILTSNNLPNSEILKINIGNCREYYINNMCAKAGFRVIASKKEGLLEYNIIKS